MPSDIRYTPDHEWLRLEGEDTAVIGITEFAQDQLGDLVYVELPEVGRQVKKGQDFAVVESVKTAAEVYSPVTGEVVAVNDTLSGNAELLKTGIESGWIAKIKIADPAEIHALMDKAAYDDFLKGLAH